MFDNIKVFILMCLNKLGLYTKSQYEDRGKSNLLLKDAFLEASLNYVSSLFKRYEIKQELNFFIKQLEGQSELTDKLNLLVEALYSDLEDERKKVEILTEQLIEKRKRK